MWVEDLKDNPVALPKEPNAQEVGVERMVVPPDEPQLAVTATILVVADEEEMVGPLEP